MCIQKMTIVKTEHTNIQVELLQGPVVSLCHILSGCCDVGFRSEKSTQPDVKTLADQEENNSSLLVQHFYSCFPTTKIRIPH